MKKRSSTQKFGSKDISFLPCSSIGVRGSLSFSLTLSFNSLSLSLSSTLFLSLGCGPFLQRQVRGAAHGRTRPSCCLVAGHGGGHVTRRQKLFVRVALVAWQTLARLLQHFHLLPPAVASFCATEPPRCCCIRSLLRARVASSILGVEGERGAVADERDGVWPSGAL